MASLKEISKGIGARALDAVFPPRCPSCHAAVAADGNFCRTCFAALTLISAPQCACCGIPFTMAMGADARCPECLAAPPAFDTARAVMVYDAISAPLITALKFHDQWAGLTRYATMMRASGAAHLADADMLVPVPLHWHRLVRRKYNQAALLAYALAEVGRIPCRLDILHKTVATRPQMRLDRAARLKNVRHAFAVNPRTAEEVKDKTVLLIDDVVTTGATVDACALVLKNAGARAVHVLSLARTVKA